MKCFTCGKKPYWMYMPDSSLTEEERYYCDKCVPRGCSCNIDEFTGKEDLDEQGRLLPCCEYIYSEFGF